MQRRRLPSTAAVLLCFFLAIIAATGTGVRAQTLLFDDFDDPTSGWATVDEKAGGHDYVDGEYALWINDVSSRQSVDIPLSLEGIEAFRIKTHVFVADGLPDVEFGVLLCGPSGIDYLVRVSADGYFRVDRTQGNDVLSSPVRWTPYGATLASGPVELAVTVDGSRLALSLNGRVLLIDEFLDEPLVVARLLAASGSQLPAEVRLCDILVEEIAADSLAESPSSSGQILHAYPYRETFDDPVSGWIEIAQPDTVSACEDGNYVFHHSEADAYAIAWAPVMEMLAAPLIVEIAAASASNASDAVYGIVLATTDRDLYVFECSADGFYTLAYLRKGDWQPSPIAWTESDLIERGRATNRLIMIVEERTASLFVNDFLLTSFDLDLSGPYQLGLYSGTGSEAPVEVRFLEFAVRAASSEDLHRLEPLGIPHCDAHSLPFSDEFGDSTSGWDDRTSETADLCYTAGRYSIGVAADAEHVASFAPVAPLDGESLVVEAEVYEASDAFDGYQGVTVGQDADSLLAFLADRRGRYSLFLCDNGEWERLVDWTYSRYIHRGGLANVLRLIMYDGTATLIVNGVKLQTVACELEMPRFGLFAGNSSDKEGGGTRGVFHYISAWNVTAEDIAWKEAPRAVEGYTLPFEEDFSGRTSGWEETTGERSWAEYRQGEYAIGFTDTNVYRICWAPLAQPCQGGFVAEVTASWSDNCNQGGIGIVWGTGNDDFYWFRIRDDGQFKVSYKRDAEWQTSPLAWTPSECIIQGAFAQNSLKVIVHDGWAFAFVNGTEVFSFELDLLGPYKTGLIADSSEVTPFETRFSWFYVGIPTPEDLSSLQTTLSLPYSDDFDDPTSGWTIEVSDVGGTDYRDDEYAIWVDVEKRTQWRWSPLTLPCPQSFTIEVTARISSGADDESWGIFWGTSFSNLYALSVSADGFYQIGLYRGDEWQDNPVDWTADSSIKTGNESNNVRIVIANGKAAVLVNGSVLTRLTLDLEGPFLVGLSGTSGDTIPSEVRIQSFSLVSPTADDLNALEEQSVQQVRSSLPFSDGFSDPSLGWEIGAGETSGKAYRDGSYAIWLSSENRLTWAWAPIVEPYPQAFVTEATAHLTSDAADAGIGLLWGEGSDDFYWFHISLDGFYMVSYQRKNTWMDAAVGWTQSDDIRQGTSSNTLRVVVKDGEASLFINGAYQTSFSLDLGGPYRVALVADSGDEVPVEARFSSFSLRLATEEDARDIIAAIEGPSFEMPFTDSFTLSTSGWQTYASEWSEKAYQGGAFKLWSANERVWNVSAAPLRGEYSDFTLETTVRKGFGGQDVKYGILWGTDWENTYWFRVAPNGLYELAYATSQQRVHQENARLVTGSCDCIHGDREANTLRVVIRDDQVTLEVNGVILETVHLEPIEGPYAYVAIGMEASRNRTPNEAFFEYFSAQLLSD